MTNDSMSVIQMLIRVFWDRMLDNIKSERSLIKSFLELSCQTSF